MVEKFKTTIRVIAYKLKSQNVLSSVWGHIQKNPSLTLLSDLAKLEKFANSNLTILENEHKLLLKIFDESIDSKSYIVDIAASDGVTMSPVYPFFKKGSMGFAVEFDPLKFAKLAFIYRCFPNVTLLRQKITPVNIAEIMNSNSVPKDFKILNLDIDSYDLEVIDSILSSGFKPELVTLEINEKIPPGIYFNVKYNPEHYWQGDHFYGCSLTAASITMTSHNYRLVWLEFNNAIFVHKNSTMCSWDSLTVETAYKTGYLDRPNVRTLFGYNHDVWHWNYLPLPEAIIEIENFFSHHHGKFELNLRTN
jgi:hypothetical protein